MLKSLRGNPMHRRREKRRMSERRRRAGSGDTGYEDLISQRKPLRCRPGSIPRSSSERLGHATVSITLDTYSHAIPAMQEEEALIAGLVFAAETAPMRG
jgi:integrase